MVTQMDPVLMTESPEPTARLVGQVAEAHLRPVDLAAPAVKGRLTTATGMQAVLQGPMVVVLVVVVPAPSVHLLDPPQLVLREATDVPQTSRAQPSTTVAVPVAEVKTTLREGVLEA